MESLNGAAIPPSPWDSLLFAISVGYGGNGSAVRGDSHKSRPDQYGTTHGSDTRGISYTEPVGRSVDQFVGPRPTLTIFFIDYTHGRTVDGRADSERSRRACDQRRIYKWLYSGKHICLFVHRSVYFSPYVAYSFYYTNAMRPYYGAT